MFKNLTKFSMKYRSNNSKRNIEGLKWPPLTCYQYFLVIFCSLHNPLKWSQRSSWPEDRRATQEAKPSKYEFSNLRRHLYLHANFKSTYIRTFLE